MLPRAAPEFLFTCGVLFLSSTLFSYVLGEIFGLVVRADEEMVSMRTYVMSVRNFLLDRNFPPDLEDDIVKHFIAQAMSSKG